MSSPNGDSVVADRQRDGFTLNSRGSQDGTPAIPGPRVERKPEVVVVEVGPRDGLQNESAPVPTDQKVAFVDALTGAGLPAIEVTSFVSPNAVPQLADASEVMDRIHRRPGVRYSALVPNGRGMERALKSGIDAIALFTSATEAFAETNVGTSIAGTFERFIPVVEEARGRQIWIRGYVSVAFGCPFSGEVSPTAVVSVAERLLELGCDEICLADTIGVATPEVERRIIIAVQASIPADRIALHLHDTSGMAIANVEAALNLDIRTFDSAAGGLGGCPFAPGAPGNLATERLVIRLEELGLHTGVDVNEVLAATALLRPFVSRLSQLPV